MDIQQTNTLVIIPEKDLKELKENSMKIISLLEKGGRNINKKWMPASEFMSLLNIQRSKFDSIKHLLRIKKMKRKIYVAAEEIDRYFEDDVFK